MKKTLIACLCLAALSSFAVQAQDVPTTSLDLVPSSDAPASNGGWSGSGEFGFASATGNSRSMNLNAKLGLNQENEQWKNSFFLDGLRAKNEQDVVDVNGNSVGEKFTTTSNRYDGGASVGYKFDPRSYIVGAARYEHDDFGANLWQGIVSLGYGYIALKDARNELSFEIGPGYKRYRSANVDVLVDGSVIEVNQPIESEVVARGLINYKFKITDNTSIENTFLTEAGSKNTYIQNDLSLAVTMTKKLGLKVGFEVRYNSDVKPGVVNTDTLTTTNLVYSF